MLNFAGRALSGIVSAAMLLFSSFEGNNAQFADVLIGHDTHAIRIRTALVHAFDNDFEQIFRSGSPIIITYTLNVRRGGTIIDTITYENMVIFDPMNRFFQIEAEAGNFYTFTDSCDELRAIISEVDIYYDHLGVDGRYDFELSAHMDRVMLSSLEREFDLMMLWNYKRPQVSFRYTVVSYES